MRTAVCIGLAVAALLVALALSFSLVMQFTREEVRLGPGSLATRRVYPWGPGRETVLESADIEDVRVRLAGPRGRIVEVVTAERSLCLGMGLRQGALEWIRDGIIAVVRG
jgi:hypothetical protein